MTLTRAMLYLPSFAFPLAQAVYAEKGEDEAKVYALRMAVWNELTLWADENNSTLWPVPLSPHQASALVRFLRDVEGG